MEEALAHEPAASRDIVMGHAAHDLFRADAVGVVGVGRGLAARGDGGQLPSLRRRCRACSSGGMPQPYRDLQ